jgi:hypothetical protein
MNCKDIDKLLTAYLEGVATPEEREQVQAHLAACSQCRDELALRQTSRNRLGQALKLTASRVTPPPGSWEQIVKQAGIKEGVGKPAPKKSGMSWLAVPLSVLLLAILIAGLLPGLGGRALPPPEAPVVVSDGAGGAILVWLATPYNYGHGIYAQHVDAGGNLLWGAEGQQIAVGKVNPPKAISDGSGGVIIVWGDGDNRYIQRLDSSGQTVWKQEEASPALEALGMVGDGSGGAILLWGTSDDRVYARRISGDGALLWGEGDVFIGKIQYAYMGMPIVSDGSGGAVFLWEDSSSGGMSIQAQRVSRDGELLWGEGGISVTAAGEIERPQLINDGTGSFIIAWTAISIDNGFDENVYAQKLDAYGSRLWGEQGVLISDRPGMQSDPKLTADGSGGGIITWRETQYISSGQSNIFAQRIDSAGEIRWQEGGVSVSNIPQESPSPDLGLVYVTGDGAGGSTVIWVADKYTGGRHRTQVYAQRLGPDGQRLWSETGVEIYKTPAFRAIGYSSVISDNTGGFIISSRVSEGIQVSNTDSVYAQRIDSAGNRRWGDGGLEIQRVPASPILPVIAAAVILAAVLVLIGVFRGGRRAQVFAAIAPVLIGIAALFSNLLLIGPFGYSYSWAYIVTTPVNLAAVAVIPIAGLVIGAVGIWKRTVTRWVMIPIVVFSSLVTIIIELIIFVSFF